MPPRPDTEITRSSILSIIVTLLLFLLAQVVAALLIGSVAVAVSSTQAAEFQDAALIKPSDASSGSPVLENGDQGDAVKIESCNPARFLRGA